MLLRLFLTFLVLLITTLIASTLRLLSILPSVRNGRHNRHKDRGKPPPLITPTRKEKGAKPTHLLIVLGSGGHTTEMFALLRDLDARTYNRRTYVYSAGDRLSAEMARKFEEKLAAAAAAAEAGAKGGEEGSSSYVVVEVPRAREVHQSLLTTPLSALRCLWACLSVLRKPFAWATPSGGSAAVGRTDVEHADLILSNGPGTAVIVVLASLILRFFNIGRVESKGRMKTIYVESWARVKRLSLSGRLLLRVVDRFLVQWESLDGLGGRAEYLGVLV